MTALTAVFGLFAAGLATVYGAWQVLDAPGCVRSAVKTGAVLALAVAALACGAPWLLIGALSVSALGDWMLSRPGENAFLAGVAAFATAHIAYIALFLSVPGSGLDQIGPGGGVIACAILILGIAMAVVLWTHAGPLRGPVTGYLVIILCMGWAALMVPGADTLSFVLPGAMLFVASDTVLALERFVVARDHAAASAMARFIWGSYWAAQAFFTLAFCLVS